VNLDAGTVLLQWSTGGLLFLWLTSRRREVGIGYGWLLRGIYGPLAIAGALLTDHRVPRLLGLLAGAAALVALAVSVVRRKAGVTGEHARAAQRAERVAAMVGSARPAPAVELGRGPEFPPVLDLVAPLFGAASLIAIAATAGGPVALGVIRLITGAKFLGAVTDAMLLGHWYLVQPGLDRAPVRQLTFWTAVIWPFEVGALLWPTGMVSVFTGAIDDGWHGLLGWMWLVCAVTTIALTGAVWLALKERSYSAVMAATGLLYLAILTASGTDLVARALLSGH
jgi:hypothetical protein